MMNIERVEITNIRKKHAILIIREVNKYYGLDCRKQVRYRDVVYPRQVAMYLINKYARLTQKDNAALFKRNHATVVHAVKTVKNIIYYDKAQRNTLEYLESIIVKDTEESELELEKSNLRVRILNIINNYSKSELINLKRQLS